MAVDVETCVMDRGRTAARVDRAGGDVGRAPRAGGSGGVVGPGGETELMTVHQNTITSLRSYETKNGVVTKVSSSGVDGKLVVWDATSVGGNGTSLISKAGGAHLRY